MNAPPFINFPANVGWVFPRANGLFMYHVPSLCYESPLDLFNSYLISAHQLYNSGNYSQAYVLLQECHAMDANHLPTLLILGCTCYSLKYYNLSIFYNNMILGIDSQFAEAYSNLGTTHRAIAELHSSDFSQKSISSNTLASSHLNLALHFYKAAIGIRPKYWDAIVNLAGLFSVLGRLDEALNVYISLENTFEQELQDFIPKFKMNSNDLDNLRILTEIHLQRNLKMVEFDKAGYNLEKRRDVAFGKGNLYLAKNNIFMAKLEFFKGIIVCGIDLYALFCKTINGQVFPSCFTTPQAAIESLKQVEQGLVDRNYHMVTSAHLQTLAKIYQDDYYDNLAIELYYLSLKLYPTPSSCNNLGIILAQQRLEESIQWYELGLSLDLKHVHLYTNLGSALKDSGRIQDGILAYQKAISLQPDFYIALANLANVYKDLGQVDEALQLYKRALLVKPDFIEAFCNFVNSSFFICDWTERDQNLQSINIIVTKQLNDGLKSVPPSVPTVLPFHTFTYSKLKAWMIREISRRNADRTLWNVLSSNWFPGFPIPVPSKTSHHLDPSQFYPYPLPPADSVLKIGYVSSDFTNHPLAHLMQSVFGLHDRNKFRVYGYSLSPDDKSVYRKNIEQGCDVFLDVSTWSIKRIVEQIALVDRIHILVNLNGYTKGGRNEIFAARPAPLQISVMGYAGTIGAGTVNDPAHCPDSRVFENIFLQDLSRRWMDYLLGDDIACPKPFVCGEKLEENETFSYPSHTRGPVNKKDDSNRIYTEGIIYMPNTYFVNDHKQGFREPDHTTLNLIFTSEKYKNISRESDELYLNDEQCIKWRKEQVIRLRMRKEIFPHIKEETVIFANFNQLYKIDPEIFATWMNILKKLPNSILWLLRFPHSGEKHLMQTAHTLVGEQVASRIVFTDVAPKNIHILRGRVADIFLDTPECNAHTTAADILWSGTPMVTYPKYDFKMCSRVGASIAFATGTWGSFPNPITSPCSFAKSLASARLQDHNLLGHLMVVDSYDNYETQALALGSSLKWSWKSLTSAPLPNTPFTSRIIPDDSPTHILTPSGLAIRLRQCLFLNRDTIPLFDTPRWVRDYESGLFKAFKKWPNYNEESRCITAGE